MLFMNLKREQIRDYSIKQDIFENSHENISKQYLLSYEVQKIFRIIAKNITFKPISQVLIKFGEEAILGLLMMLF